MLCEISEIRSKQLSELLQLKQQVILCQTPDTLSGVCETLKLYKPYGVTFSKIGFWDGPPAAGAGFAESNVNFCQKVHIF